MNQNTHLLDVRDLCKYYTAGKKLFRDPVYLKAVDHISFSLDRGETLGLVGESGCGKSTLGRTILRLTPATSGQIIYDGQNIADYNPEQMRHMRKKMQMIFQDPYASLNPRMTVRETIRSPLDVFHIGTSAQREERVLQVMSRVGLNEYHLNRYPHEFSGGQRQRVVIARALITNPEFIVCDEPVSALDVSVRSQVLNLLQDLQEEYKLAYLFVSHDLSVVKHISDRIAVMYLGNIVELADKNALYSNPLHPYTQALMSAIPIPDVDVKRTCVSLTGEIPSPINPPAGCKFSTRCPYATEQCRKEAPSLREVVPGQFVACHRVKEI